VAALETISAKLATAAEVSRATLARTEEASRAAEDRLAAADAALQAVQGIGQQSRMLAINASVEATRAGEAGRAFGVIAREMLGLADGARLTSNNIQGTLRDVTASVHRLDEAGRASSAEAAQAVETLRQVEGLLGSLRTALEGQGSGRDLRTSGAGQRRIGSSSR
jgi:methyl-accepting chemotaxis protein